MVLISILLLLICCITISFLTLISKCSSQLPEANIESIKLLEKYYIYKKAEEKNYLSDIKDYDSLFTTYKGTDVTGTIKQLELLVNWVN